MKNTKKNVFLSLMIAYSLVLYFIESMLPSIYFIAPGAKLGLTNIITISLLYIMGARDAFIVVVIRILLSSIFGGGMSAFMYSISGGIMSLIAMYLMKKINFKHVSLIGISVVGALFFNIGQILVSALIIKNISIFVYLPVLAYISLGTGILVGYASKFIVERTKFIKYLT
ncbi:MAG: Gx transporter family protein [Proteocatella sp.]